jgi:hypothetical protein
MDTQKKARAALVDERNREAGTLAALKAERAAMAAEGRQIETEAAPIRYRQREGCSVVDRVHGPVLRPSCYRVDGLGVSPAVIAAFCTVQMAMQRGAIDLLSTVVQCAT